MPYLTNSIGAYSFVELRGRVEYAKEQIEILQRVGVDGTGLRKLGSRGRPFDLVSKQYFSTFTTAKTELTNYMLLPGAAAAALTQNGVAKGNYFVIDVVEVDTVPVLTPSGNATSTHTALLIARWKLCAAG